MYYNNTVNKGFTSYPQNQYNHNSSMINVEAILRENEMLKEHVMTLESKLQFVTEENEKFLNLFQHEVGESLLHQKVMQVSEENQRMEAELLHCRNALEQLNSVNSQSFPVEFIARVDALEQELELCKAEKEAFADHARKVELLFAENEKLLRLCEFKDQEVSNLRNEISALRSTPKTFNPSLTNQFQAEKNEELLESLMKENGLLRMEVEMLEGRERDLISTYKAAN